MAPDRPHLLVTEVPGSHPFLRRLTACRCPHALRGRSHPRSARSYEGGRCTGLLCQAPRIALRAGTVQHRPVGTTAHELLAVPDRAAAVAPDPDPHRGVAGVEDVGAVAGR